MGVESLRGTEHLTAPDFTNFLCVLQIWLYCFLKVLGGADVDELAVAGAVLGVVGREPARTVCL